MMPIRAMLLRQAAGSSGGDPHWASVSALLHFDGPNDSTAIVDEKGNVWTAYNNARISTSQSKFGGSSLYLDGSSDYIETPFATPFVLGSGDFTIEAFIRPAAAVDGSVISQRNSGAAGWAIEARGTGAVWVRALIGGIWSDTRITTSPGVVALNAWSHLAFVRHGDSWTIYVNGNNEGAITSSGVIDNNAAPLRLGRSQQSSENDFNGHIDEVRVTKGVARYTGNFTPPTAPFPND